MAYWRQSPETAERRREADRKTMTKMMMPMITTAAMRIHSQTSDEPVELAGDGATDGAAVAGGAVVVGASVVGASVVGGAVGPVVGEPFPVGRVGRVTLGATLLIALLSPPPQPAASNPTARAATTRTTLFVRRRMPGSLRAFAFWKLPMANTFPPRIVPAEPPGFTRHGGSCSARVTHRKPRWPVAVSIVSLCRAAGRACSDSRGRGQKIAITRAG